MSFLFCFKVGQPQKCGFCRHQTFLSAERKGHQDCGNGSEVLATTIHKLLKKIGFSLSRLVLLKIAQMLRKNLRNRECCNYFQNVVWQAIRSETRNCKNEIQVTKDWRYKCVAVYYVIFARYKYYPRSQSSLVRILISPEPRDNVACFFVF